MVEIAMTSHDVETTHALPLPTMNPVKSLMRLPRSFDKLRNRDRPVPEPVEGTVVVRDIEKKFHPIIYISEKYTIFDA